MRRGARHNLHQSAGADRRAHFRVPGALLTGNRHRVALRNIFAANIAGKQVVIGQRETFFQLIPQLTGDRRLHAQIPPVLIEGIARQLRLLGFGATSDQVGPFGARGVIHIPVHQLTYPRHLRPGGQRRIDGARGFIDAEGILLAKTLRGDHRVEASLLHQRAKDRLRLLIPAALQQQIRLPIAPFVFLFRLHRQTRQPGVEAMAIARPQRHPYPPLHQRRGLRTHDCVIAPDGLLFGYIATHQAPGDNIAQFLGLILIELLSLYQRRDHQAGIFHVLAGDAGEGDGGHLTGKVRRPGGAGEGEDAVWIVSQGDHGAGDALVVGGHLLGQRFHQPDIAGLHRQADPFEIGQRILLTGVAPGAEQRFTGAGLILARQPQLFRPAPGLLRLPHAQLGVVIVALRLGAGRLIRAKRQQAAPVAAPGQFIHEART